MPPEVSSLIEPAMLEKSDSVRSIAPENNGAINESELAGTSHNILDRQALVEIIRSHGANNVEKKITALDNQGPNFILSAREELARQSMIAEGYGHPITQELLSKILSGHTFNQLVMGESDLINAN